jgi:hypothetical protein
MGPADHHRPGLRAFGGQRREYPVENPRPAPADEAVLKGLVQTIDGGSVAPHQPAPNDMDDAADDPPVIDPRHASRLVRQQWLQACELRIG